MRQHLCVILVLFGLARCSMPIVPRTSASLVPPAPTTVQTKAVQTQGTLAYLANGDVFVRVLPDGQARRLTVDGQNQRPQWSPSGAWLAFCKGTALWLVRRDGSAAHATGACGDRWLPDADRTVPANDTLWNADRTAYVFVRTTLTGQYDTTGVPERVTQLWRANADGSHATMLLDTGSAHASAPYGLVLAAWYGDQILYWQDPSFSHSLLADGQPLWALAATGGTPRQITPALLLYDDFRALAPDRTTLALTVGGDRESWTTKRIATLDLAQDTLTYLTDAQTAAIAPAWSPDSTAIAYVAMRDSAQQPAVTDNHALAMQRHIWVMQRNGSGQQQLTHAPIYGDEAPRFTADGTHILFARFTSTDQVSIWLMRADGTALVRVADGVGIKTESHEAPTWFGYYGHVAWAQLFDWTPYTDGADSVAPR